MDIINGVCVICAEEKSVLTRTNKKKFLDLLKTYYFSDNQIEYTKFFKLLDAKKGICIECAYIIDRYDEIRVGINSGISIKRKLIGKRCNLCNSSKKITNGTSQLKKAMSDILKDIKKQPRINYLCLHCCFCIQGWHQIKNSISKILNEDSSSGNESEDSFRSNNDKRRLSTSSNKHLNNSKEMSLLKRKSTETINKNLKRIRKPSTSDESGKETNKRRTTRTVSKQLNEKLKHLSNVNSETLSKDMRLSYSVVTDQKMMFDVPYIPCDKKKMRPPAQSKKIVPKEKIKFLKIKKELGLQEPAIEISDDELNSSSLSMTSSVGVRRSGRKRTICDERESPARVTPKVKKNKILIITDDDTKTCEHCKKSYKRKYRTILHELEHETSYSPKVLIVEMDLLQELNKIKTKIHSEQESDNSYHSENDDQDEKTQLSTDSSSMTGHENVSDSEIVTTGKKFDDFEKLINSSQSTDDSEEIMSASQSTDGSEKVTDVFQSIKDSETQINDSQEIDDENVTNDSKQKDDKSHIGTLDSEKTDDDTEKILGDSETITEKAIVDSETTKDDSEKTIIDSETTNVDSEKTIVDSETTKDNSEKTIVDSETTKDNSEKSIVDSETTKDDSEKTIADSESTKDDSEKTIVDSETTKDDSEKTIVDSETTKVDSEKTITDSKTLKDNSGKTIVDSEKTIVDSETTKDDSENEITDSESTKNNSEKILTNLETTKNDSEKTIVDSDTTKDDSEKENDTEKHLSKKELESAEMPHNDEVKGNGESKEDGSETINDEDEDERNTEITNSQKNLEEADDSVLIEDNDVSLNEDKEEDMNNINKNVIDTKAATTNDKNKENEEKSQNSNEKENESSQNSESLCEDTIDSQDSNTSDETEEETEKSAREKKISQNSDYDSEIESLKISSQGSSGNEKTRDDNLDANGSSQDHDEDTNIVYKSSVRKSDSADPYAMVESLLHNLGA